MKTHIFIATTQGLVAIQNITPIDDEDISSVISVNGTSTTANISASYHNFVKKGVGIIHQMFGACSYRVDISARIDQGNSWQVAMYLAHLAQSKGLLGNGEVSQGDTVICATGEVNTSNHQVLTVNEVPCKLKLAQPQLKEWIRLGAKVTFLVPQANQHDVKQADYITLVSSLEQAAAALPISHAKSQSSAHPSKKTVSVNYRHISIVITVFLVSGLFLWLNNLASNNTVSQQPINHAPKITPSGLANKMKLVGRLKQGKTCARTTNQSMPVVKNQFVELALDQLCDLTLQTGKSMTQVLLVAQDAYTVMPLIQRQNVWKIPLPKNRLSSRQYFLVTLVQTLPEAKIEQLRVYREAMPEPNMLTESALTDWLQEQEIEFAIYTHKLVVQGID